MCLRWVLGYAIRQPYSLSFECIPSSQSINRFPGRPLLGCDRARLRPVFARLGSPPAGARDLDRVDICTVNPVAIC